MTYDRTDAEWREHVKSYRLNPLSWDRRELGARPGHNGCRVPPHILDEFGYPLVFKFDPKQQQKSEGGDKISTHDRKKSWDWKSETIDVRDLCDKAFPAVKFIVPGLFPEGVTLLVSRPKLGKTWLLLQIGSAVASGVIVLVSQVPDESPLEGDVLYLNLEDGERRAQRRMTKLFGARREMWPARMKLATRWRKFDQGGLDDIRAWCLSVVRPVLVMIDTLKKVRPRKKPNQNDYDADYEACEGLKVLVEEFPGLAILVAHHDRKMDADDVFDTVSGTLGLTGGVDTIAILKRRSQRVTLYIESRDLLEEVAKAVRFDRETCRWIIEGEAAEVHRSDERKRVLEALKGVEGGRSPLEIAALANLSHANAKQLLVRMAEAGEVRKAGYGRYCHPDVPIEGSTQTTESDKSDRVTVTETLKTDVVSDGYGKSDKSDSILPDTGVDANSSKSCHSVTLSLLPKMDVISSGYKSDTKSDNQFHVTSHQGEGNGGWLAGPRSDWATAAPDLANPADAVALAALEGDVPLEMGDPVTIAMNWWQAAIEPLEAKERRLAERSRPGTVPHLRPGMATGTFS